MSVHNTLAQQTFRGQRQGDEIKARRKPKGGRNGTPLLKTVGDATGVFLFLFLFFLGCLPCRSQSLVSPLRERLLLGVR